MIRSFRDSAAARLFADEDVSKLRAIERPARRKLLLLDGAVSLADLRSPPGNRLGLSQNRLARDIDVNPARVNDIVHGRSAITASIALRLAKYFGTSAEMWLNLQSGYDLRRAREGEWRRVESRVRVLLTE
ncbi:MAG: HigA family addiction module antitoxin [Hyphomicrobiaceae bacterium]